MKWRFFYFTSDWNILWVIEMCYEELNENILNDMETATVSPYHFPEAFDSLQVH